MSSNLAGTAMVMLQPSPFPKSGQIDASRRVPSIRAVASAQAERHFFVAVRNAERRSRAAMIRLCRSPGFRRVGHRPLSRQSTVTRFARFRLAGRCARVRYPIPSWSVLVKKLPVHRRRRRIARRRLDPVPLRDRGGKLPHRGRGRPVRIAAGTNLRTDPLPLHGARGEPADDSSRRIAYGVDRRHHLLPADQHVVEQTLQLRCHARIDERRIGALQDREQRETPFRRHDVLPLRRQEALPLQPRDDLRARGRRLDPLRLLQPFPQRFVPDCY